MPRSKKSSPKKAFAPPRDASLPGLPAELRNIIYHLVVEDIDEVNFIARKIEPGPADAKDRLWDIVAKHPLTQTCRQLRQDFDPIHRRKSMVTGVDHYVLEVDNYDVGRLGDFARLLDEVPSVVTHVRACVNNGRPLVRFHLNNNIITSVDKVRQDLKTPGQIRTPFMELRALLLEGSIARMRYDSEQFTWWITRGTVSCKMRSQTMSATEKKAAVSQPNERHARKTLVETCNGISTYSYDGNSGGQYVHVLSLLHTREHDRLTRKAKKDKLRPELRAQLTREIKDEVEIKLRKQLKTTAKQPTCAVQKVKSGLRKELKWELKKELNQEIGRDVKAEIRAQLKAEQKALREKEKDKFREELRQEHKAELMAEIRAGVKAEVRVEVESELREKLKAK